MRLTRNRPVVLLALFSDRLQPRKLFRMRGAGRAVTRGARGRFDVVPRESALSSGHTGRSRSCDDSHDSESCRWREGGEGGGDGSDERRGGEQRAKFVRRIECAFIWRACTRTYVAGGEERRER